MKKLLLLFLVSTTTLTAQELTIANGESTTLKSGTIFSASGLVLTPNVDYTLTSSVSRATTPATQGSDASISKVITFSSDLENYQGDLTFIYSDSELNGLTETSLVLASQYGAADWEGRASTINTDANSITTTIATPNTFSSITAFAEGVLSIEVVHTPMQISLYPNPTVAEVHINSDEDLSVTVYDVLGKKILNTQEKTIDLSGLQSGLYLFRITDNKTKRTNTYKIIKK